MRRISTLIYGIVSYACFFLTFVYAVGWIGNFGVPRSLDSGEVGPLGTALSIDLALLTVFALQHSIMARPGFKAKWTKIVPEPAERATYVLASSAAMILMFWLWQPIGGTVWSAESPALRSALTALFLVGPLTVLLSSFLIDHFDLFGLRQVMLYFRGKPYTEKSFTTPGPYKYIRHPLYVGWFITFWATPTMTAGHLLLALGTTAYILTAIVFEERDLSELLGEEYRHYRASTPMFLPRLRRATAIPAGDGTSAPFHRGATQR